MMRIDDILARIDYLPPFPLTVSRALDILRRPDITPNEAAEAVKFDQAMAANILRLCNSSYYGLLRSITNLREAVVYIGLGELQRIIIRSGVKRYFANRTEGYEVESGELWVHVLATSVLSRKAGALIGLSDSDGGFIAALLHDVGKLVMTEFVKDSLPDIEQRVRTDGISFMEAEKLALGIDHAEIGARVLDGWGFDHTVVNAVRRHHASLQPDDTTLDHTVRIADSLAMSMGFGTTVDGLAYHGIADLMEQYELSHKVLEEIMATSLDEIISIATDYGLSTEA